MQCQTENQQSFEFNTANFRICFLLDFKIFQVVFQMYAPIWLSVVRDKIGGQKEGYRQVRWR